MACHTSARSRSFPGERFVYEFELHQNGTFFYHSHGAMQEMMGMLGMFILHPRSAYAPKVDHDFGILLQEWALLPNNSVPNTAGMEFNWLTFNGKAGPATMPIVVPLNSRVRIRLVNLGMDHHPIHVHGHTFEVTGTEGGRKPPTTWEPRQHGAGWGGAGARCRVRRQQSWRLDGPLPPAAPHDEQHDGPAERPAHLHQPTIAKAGGRADAADHDT